MEQQMAHETVAAAEEIMDQEFPVLDKGFVRLVDYMGGDGRVVQAARVSYGSGTKTYREDRGLINYLMRNEHSSPFEQVVLTFHVKMPLFVARQWIRHRTARVNEISGRYSVMEDEFYIPAGGDIATQSSDNKQGRSDVTLDPQEQAKLQAEFVGQQKRAYQDYQAHLGAGVARELARINLPLSLYTQWYWQIDLRNLFHFLKLRMDPHAQLEIRRYAEVIYEITKKVAPLSCEAFQEHVLEAVTFAASERQALRALLDGRENPLTGKALQRFEEKLKREVR
ncbi:MAG TPA: FAD-dependent thymidylate synthase [Sediminispirochaeta sp.]|nr:FAD-dependent thymidylate synthase [Sediminispirochaeta sp.]